MQVKDYYKILELNPSATLKEIKAAYRRLAHLYHPDKNNQDPYATAQFESIKEAYEILSNPSRKNHYLQQRWYEQSIGRKSHKPVITPVSVLKRMIELDKYVATIDVHRMDAEGLYAYICDILSDETIEKLNGFNEPDINKSIIESTLKSSRSLPSNLMVPLSQRLLKLDSDSSSYETIQRAVIRAKQSDAWSRYRILVVLLVVILLCLLIYRISH